MKNNKLIKVGLTGGIGSGKSLVAKFMKEAGLEVFDMDEAGKKIFLNTKVQKKIKKLFPKAIKNNEKLDRNFIKNVIFSDKKLKKKIEKILHPLLKKEFIKFCKKIARKKVVICEAALLIETGYYKNFDFIIVVIAKKEIRKNRIKKRDKINEDLIRKIFKNQTTDRERRKRADYVINNNESISDLKRKVFALSKKLIML